jgi:hypothetical protein
MRAACQIQPNQLSRFCKSSSGSHRRLRGNKAVFQQDSFQFFNIRRITRVYNGSSLKAQETTESVPGALQRFIARLSNPNPINNRVKNAPPNHLSPPKLPLAH